MHKMKNFLKNEPEKSALGAVLLTLLLISAVFFSFSVLQSDDYYYSTFWQKGPLEFIRLTINHFKTVNGRAIVHFFAQTALFLPRILRAVFHSLVILAIGILSGKFIGLDKSKKSLYIYLLLFYSAFYILSPKIMREAIMWTSAFYNYVFPALLILIALTLCKKKGFLTLLICFISGATTEQWGITSVAMICAVLYFSLPVRKTFDILLKHFSPVFMALLGYMTIFLSPATLSRITNFAHAEVSASLFDLQRFGETLFTSSAIHIVLFIVISMVPAFVNKGRYSILLFGFMPLFFTLTHNIHHSYISSLIVFLCYLLLCLWVFYKSESCVFILGAIVSLVIMIPTNTFEYRIAFPCVILLIISSLSILFSLKVHLHKKIILPVVSIVIIFSLALFYPTFMGFCKNYQIEKTNFDAIKDARNTSILYYNIDYNKNYAVRQMFNDGYFYQTFLSLYHLDNCKVILVSENNTPIKYKGKILNVKGYMQDGITYIPMRAFLEETGGTIKVGSDVVMRLNGKSLTLSDGIFTFTDNSGKINYLIADDYKLNNFYTLYINEELCKKAFGY
ncbi:MAG: DUF6056 family protein [Clostridia bacterium]